MCFIEIECITVNIEVGVIHYKNEILSYYKRYGAICCYYSMYTYIKLMSIQVLK